MRSLLTIFCFTLVATQVAIAEVTIQPLSGESVKAELVSINAEQLQYKREAKVQSIATRELLAVQLHEQAISQTTSLTILLHNGTYLLGSEFEMQGEQLQWTLLSEDKIAIPVTQIKALKLQASAADLLAEWDRLTQEATTTDRLIIRKKNDSEVNLAASPFSLDVLEGVIQEIKNDVILFENEGEILRVKREKVEGIIYRSRPLTTKAPFVVVVDIDNSRWACSSIEFHSEHWQIATSENLSLKIPPNRVRSLDFSTINVRYLSANLVENSQRENLLQVKHAQPHNFAPGFDRSPAGPLYVQGKLCEHGVWMPATSVLTLRVPENFTRFSFQATYDDNLDNSDGASLFIEADGKKLYEKWVPRDQLTQEIVLPLQASKRLRISVKPGGTSYIGDTMVLKEARFLP